MARADREPGLDLYRGFMVVGMFTAHTARLQARAPLDSVAEHFADAALRSVLWLEPYIEASFLFLAGASVVLSHASFLERGANESEHAWLSRALWRAWGLGILSAVLFLAHYGWVTPDVWASSGILSVIAFGTAGAALATCSRRPALGLGLLCAISLLASAVIEQRHVSVVGVNAGEGALLPEVSFVFAGALCARVIRGRGPRALTASLSAAAAASILSLVTAAPFIGHHERLLPSQSNETILGALYSGHELSMERVPIAFWNHTPLGCLGSLLPLLASAVACGVVTRRAPRSILVRGGVLLGRHALFAYLGHLAILGAADALALSPQHALATWLWVAVLIAAVVLPWAFVPARGRARGAFHTRS